MINVTDMQMLDYIYFVKRMEVGIQQMVFIVDTQYGYGGMNGYN